VFDDVFHLESGSYSKGHTFVKTLIESAFRTELQRSPGAQVNTVQPTSADRTWFITFFILGLKHLGITINIVSEEAFCLKKSTGLVIANTGGHLFQRVHPTCLELVKSNDQFQPNWVGSLIESSTMKDEPLSTQ